MAQGKVELQEKFVVIQEGDPFHYTNDYEQAKSTAKIACQDTPQEKAQIYKLVSEYRMPEEVEPTFIEFERV